MMDRRAFLAGCVATVATGMASAASPVDVDVYLDPN